MAKALLPRKKKFADKVLKDNMNGAEAARAVGVPDNIAAQTAYRWLHKDQGVRAYLFKEMEKAGITDPYVAQKMKEGMSAMTKPVKEGGERYEDYFVRKQYIDMYFRLKGMYAPEKSEHTETQIILNITPQLSDGLKDALGLEGEEADVFEAEIIREGELDG